MIRVYDRILSNSMIHPSVSEDVSLSDAEAATKILGRIFNTFPALSPVEAATFFESFFTPWGFKVYRARRRQEAARRKAWAATAPDGPKWSWQ